MKSKNKNIKNLAKAMLAKYIMVFLYCLGLLTLISGHNFISGIILFICVMLLAIKIGYDLRFIKGEMQK